MIIFFLETLSLRRWPVSLWMANSLLAGSYSQKAPVASPLPSRALATPALPREACSLPWEGLGGVDAFSAWLSDTNFEASRPRFEAYVEQLSDLGGTDKAIHLLERGTKILASRPSASYAELGAYYFQLFELYKVKKDFRARLYLLRAYELARAEEESLPAGIWIMLCTQLGEEALSRQAYPEARGYYTRALERLEAEPRMPRKKTQIGLLWSRIAKAYQREGNAQHAERSARVALSFLPAEEADHAKKRRWLEKLCTQEADEARGEEPPPWQVSSPGEAEPLPSSALYPQAEERLGWLALKGNEGSVVVEEAERVLDLRIDLRSSDVFGLSIFASLPKKRKNQYEGLARMMRSHEKKQEKDLWEAEKITSLNCQSAEKLPSQRRDPVAFHYALGEWSFAMGHYLQAVSHYREAVNAAWQAEAPPETMARLYHHLATSYYMREHFQEALFYYELALKSGEYPLWTAPQQEAIQTVQAYCLYRLETATQAEHRYAAEKAFAERKKAQKEHANALRPPALSTIQEEESPQNICVLPPSSQVPTSSPEPTQAEGKGWSKLVFCIVGLAVPAVFLAYQAWGGRLATAL